MSENNTKNLAQVVPVDHQGNAAVGPGSQGPTGPGESPGGLGKSPSGSPGGGLGKSPGGGPDKSPSVMNRILSTSKSPSKSPSGVGPNRDLSARVSSMSIAQRTELLHKIRDARLRREFGDTVYKKSLEESQYGSVAVTRPLTTEKAYRYLIPEHLVESWREKKRASIKMELLESGKYHSVNLSAGVIEKHLQEYENQHCVRISKIMKFFLRNDAKGNLEFATSTLVHEILMHDVGLKLPDHSARVSEQLNAVNSGPGPTTSSMIAQRQREMAQSQSKAIADMLKSVDDVDEFKDVATKTFAATARKSMAFGSGGSRKSQVVGSTESLDAGGPNNGGNAGPGPGNRNSIGGTNNNPNLELAATRGSVKFGQRIFRPSFPCLFEARSIIIDHLFILIVGTGCSVFCVIGRNLSLDDMKNEPEKQDYWWGTPFDMEDTYKPLNYPLQNFLFAVSSPGWFLMFYYAMCVFLDSAFPKQGNIMAHFFGGKKNSEKSTTENENISPYTDTRWWLAGEIFGYFIFATLAPIPEYFYPSCILLIALWIQINLGAFMPERIKVNIGNISEIPEWYSTTLKKTIMACNEEQLLPHAILLLIGFTFLLDELARVEEKELEGGAVTVQQIESSQTVEVTLSSKTEYVYPSWLRRLSVSGISLLLFGLEAWQIAKYSAVYQSYLDGLYAKYDEFGRLIQLGPKVVVTDEEGNLLPVLEDGKDDDSSSSSDSSDSSDDEKTKKKKAEKKKKKKLDKKKKKEAPAKKEAPPQETPQGQEDSSQQQKKLFTFHPHGSGWQTIKKNCVHLYTEYILVCNIYQMHTIIMTCRIVPVLYDLIEGRGKNQNFEKVKFSEEMLNIPEDERESTANMYITAVVVAVQNCFFGTLLRTEWSGYLTIMFGGGLLKFLAEPPTEVELCYYRTRTWASYGIFVFLFNVVMARLLVWGFDADSSLYQALPDEFFGVCGILLFSALLEDFLVSKIHRPDWESVQVARLDDQIQIRNNEDQTWEAELSAKCLEKTGISDIHAEVNLEIYAKAEAERNDEEQKNKRSRVRFHHLAPEFLPHNYRYCDRMGTLLIVGSSIFMVFYLTFLSLPSLFMRRHISTY